MSYPQTSLLYLDDLRPGQKFKSGSVQITEADILEFASKFDPQPFHLDPVAGERSFFGTMVASGWHTASLTMRLLTQGGLPLAGGIIGLKGEVTWLRPVKANDVLSVDCEIVLIEPFRKWTDRGTVTVKTTTKNQDSADVQELIAKLLVFRRTS